MQPCFIVCEVTVPTAGRKLLSAQPQAAASPDLSLDHHVVFVRLVDRVIVTWDHEEKAKLKVKLSASLLRMCETNVFGGIAAVINILYCYVPAPNSVQNVIFN